MTIPVLLDTAWQLREYFAGKRTRFHLHIAMQGTPFQKRVWNALLEIPYGERRTYRDIATRIGKRQATRAVGAAIGRNPLSIIAPCHRVIGSSGNLTGFAGGLPAKARLLETEDRALR
jgi:methylated-DNA-[protein]-cysteine S-methyltransferase